MKRFWSFSILLILMLPAAKAQRFVAKSTLQIQLTTGNNLAVEIDGRNYSRVSNTLTLGNIPSGKHRLRVYQIENRNGARKGVTVFEGSIRVKAASFHSIMVDPGEGRLRIRTAPIGDYRQIPDDGDAPKPRNRDTRTSDDNSEDPTENRSSNQTLTKSLSKEKMEKLKARVDNTITDTEKLKLLKGELQNIALSSRELVEILSWLTFDESKLELAKFKGPSLTDPENIGDVVDTLNFESNKTELRDYLRTKPQNR